MTILTGLFLVLGGVAINAFSRWLFWTVKRIRARAYRKRLFAGTFDEFYRSMNDDRHVEFDWGWLPVDEKYKRETEEFERTWEAFARQRKELRDSAALNGSTTYHARQHGKPNPAPASPPVETDPPEGPKGQEGDPKDAT